MPTDGSANGVSSRATKSDAHTASLLIRMITSAFPASAAPRFTARPKPRFSRVPDDGHPREARGEHLQRPVARRVVDDDDLDRDGLGFDARDGLCEQFAGVQRRDDDDGPHATRHDTRMRRVVMWSTDPVGKQMAGPGIRYHRLAIELSQRFTTLVASGEVGFLTPVFRPVDSVDPRRVWRLDVVVAQSLPLGVIRSLRGAGVGLVFRSVRAGTRRGCVHLAEDRSVDRPAPSAMRRSSRSRGLRSCSETHSSAPANGSAITGWELSPRWVECHRRSMQATRLCGRSSPSCRSGSTRLRPAPGQG